MTENIDTRVAIMKTPERFLESVFPIFAGSTRNDHKSITQNIFTENAINSERKRRYKNW
jgi:hypothetical protein